MVSFQGIGGTRNLRWHGFLVKSLQLWETGSLVMVLALPRFWGLEQILDLGLSFICKILPLPFAAYLRVWWGMLVRASGKDSFC